MKRLATHIISAIFALLALNGCSHNNGDIGPWFGLWHLDSIEIDGTTDISYDGNFYFMFQGKVFCLRWVDENIHDYIDSFAEWEVSDDGTTMTVNFVDPRFSPRVSYNVPDTYLSVITIFKVLALDDKEMIIEHTNNLTGIVYTYHLTKWR